MREPWRMAVAHLAASMSIDQILSLPLPFLDEVGEERIRAVGRMVQAGINAPPTSSAGLLFDAAAALLGVPGSIRTGYEGQAAIELELLARGPSAVAYPSTLRSGTDGWVVETGAVPAAILADLATGTAPEEIAARFHRTMAEIVDALCRRIRLESGLSAIALSGGTFQNMLLLGQVLELLHASDFTVYLHRRVPAGDGGLSLGQAVLGDSMSRAGFAA
jgi:hydrogenase maturation protein HypF